MEIAIILFTWSCCRFSACTVSTAANCSTSTGATGDAPKPPKHFDELPLVTVQLPMYNEIYVAERLLEGVAPIDYPRDKLEIQVLDDSTDETQRICRAQGRRAARARLRHRSTSTAPTAPASRPARSRTG